ncbi:hypothetical protein J8273_3196 [Carpediemonas membranifera]|uniref:Uncharacterized protein n=1 Tax=Carpediemonas membranifera TaxID=201153 RepID=A0A8J6E3E8_9EUKA|nr:hypothetical protein J8273_3196 [Carpediemonas membranifera]|eukprot:KAG9393067.1 hypothetical protein J8273_3196 [Carpediemonas membranifera]
MPWGDMDTFGSDENSHTFVAASIALSSTPGSAEFCPIELSLADRAHRESFGTLAGTSNNNGITNGSVTLVSDIPQLTKPSDIFPPRPHHRATKAPKVDHSDDVRLIARVVFRTLGMFASVLVNIIGLPGALVLVGQASGINPLLLLWIPGAMLTVLSLFILTTEVIWLKTARELDWKPLVIPMMFGLEGLVLLMTLPFMLDHVT